MSVTQNLHEREKSERVILKRRRPRRGARTNPIDYHACIDHRCLHGINSAHNETLTKRRGIENQIIVVKKDKRLVNSQTF